MRLRPLRADTDLRSAFGPGATRARNPRAVHRQLKRALRVFELRAADNSYDVKDIQLVLQHTPGGMPYAGFRKQWDRRLRHCRGRNEPWPKTSWGPGSTQGWRDRLPSEGLGALLVLPYAASELLPEPWEERVTLVAVPFFIPVNPGLNVRNLESFTAGVVEIWIEQLPANAAPLLAPPILEMTRGSTRAKERKIAPLPELAWPLPAHPSLRHGSTTSLWMPARHP